MPSFVRQKEMAKHRPRKILMDNDGCDAVYQCETADPNVLLDQRTRYLVDSNVDTLFYCSWSSGLSVFTHNTKVGSVFDTKKIIFHKNKAPDFIAQGKDCLAIVTDFCRANQIEMFWTMRMNDVHDNHGAEYSRTMFEANRFKMENPDCMISSYGERPPYGAGTAADFEKAKVRDLAEACIEEVLENYDIDGFLLDFFRHPVFFKEPAYGKPSTKAQLAIMSEFVGRIHALAEEKGKKRGRPFLMAVRVPDSVPFCNIIGLDIEHWMKNGWVDLLITSSYLKLNRWEYTVALGRRYGVPVYPSLDETRVRDEQANRERKTLKAFRARVMNVWQSGADGVFIFNHAGLNRDDLIACVYEPLADPKHYSLLEKDYHASVRGVGSVAGSCYPHDQWINIPVLNPNKPIFVDPDKTSTAIIQMGNEQAELEKKRFSLALRFESTEPIETLDMFFNGTPIKPFDRKESSIICPLDEKMILAGQNAVFLHNKGSQRITLTDACIQVRKLKDK